MTTKAKVWKATWRYIGARPEPSELVAEFDVMEDGTIVGGLELPPGAYFFGVAVPHGWGWYPPFAVLW